MNNKQGEYLEAICKTGSVTAAATYLYISRTAISHAITELEDEFGAALFVRTKTGLELTQAGEIVRKLYIKNKELYNIAHHEIECMNDKLARHYIKLALTATTGERFYPEFFREFYEKYPDITCDVGEIPAGDTIQSVRNGEIECAITPIDFPPEGCDDIGKIFLHKMHSLICVSKTDPLSLEKCLTKAMVRSRKFVTLTSPNPMKMPIVATIRVNNLNLVHDIVKNNMAISILPEDYIRNWDDVVAIPFEEPMWDEVNFIWSKELPHSEAFEKLLDFVKSYDLTKIQNKEGFPSYK